MKMTKGDGHAPRFCHGWGRGYWTTKPVDGIYMVSNIAYSTRIWNHKIVRDDEKNIDVIGHLGKKSSIAMKLIYQLIKDVQ